MESRQVNVGSLFLFWVAYRRLASGCHDKKAEFFASLPSKVSVTLLEVRVISSTTYQNAVGHYVKSYLRVHFDFLQHTSALHLATCALKVRSGCWSQNLL